MRTYKGKAFDALVNQYRNAILQEKKTGERVKHLWERLNVSENQFAFNMDKYEKEIQAHEKALVDVLYLECWWPWKIYGVSFMQRIYEKWDRERACGRKDIPEHTPIIPESEMLAGEYGTEIDWSFQY